MMKKRFYLSLKTNESSKDWEKQPQKAIYAVDFDEAMQIAKREAKYNKCMARLSLTEGYNNNGSHFSPF